jgi:hypothetical protein
MWNTIQFSFSEGMQAQAKADKFQADVEHETAFPSALSDLLVLQTTFSPFIPFHPPISSPPGSINS